MKRKIPLLAAFALAATVAAATLSACFAPPSEGTIVAAFSGEEKPYCLIPTYGSGYGGFVMLMSRYGHAGPGTDSVAICDADLSAKPETVYSAAESDGIFRLAASGRYIAWFERNLSGAGPRTWALKYLDRGADVPAAHKIFEKKFPATSNQMQFSYVGVYENKILWLNFDYEKAVSEILCYDILDDSTEALFSVPFADKNDGLEESVTFINIKDNFLIYGVRRAAEAPAKIFVYNLKLGQDKEEFWLPEHIAYCYMADYDAPTHGFALYYYNAATEKDGVGYISATQTPVKEFYTPGKTELLYEDRITLVGETVFYNSQHNVSGKVADHYGLLFPL